MKATTGHAAIQSLVVALAACRSAPHGERAIATQEIQMSTSVKDSHSIVIHPLDAEDAAPMSASEPW